MDLTNRLLRIMLEDTPTDEDPPDSTDTDDDAPARAEPDDQAIREIDHRVEEIEEAVESTDTTMRSIRDEQSAVAEDVEEMQETVRKLLGVYEQVTDDVNPFADAESTDGEFQFGVVADEQAVPDGGDHDAPADDEDESVGIDDLRDQRRDASADPAREDNEMAPPHGTAGAGSDDTEGATSDDIEDSSAPGEATETADDVDRDQSRPAGPVDEPDEPTKAEAGPLPGDSISSSPGADSVAQDPPVEDWTMSTRRRTDPTPIELADTYATDILVSEWLSELITSSSPAAATNAIAYYNDIGWIGDDAEAYLLDVLSGPNLDAGVDPSAPDALEAADHAESYAYVRKLAAIREMTGSKS